MRGVYLVKESVQVSYDLLGDSTENNSTVTAATEAEDLEAATNNDVIVVEIAWFNNLSFAISCLMVFVLFIIHCKRLELIEKQA